MNWRSLLYSVAHVLFVLAFAVYGAVMALVGGAISLVPAPKSRARLVIVGGGFTAAMWRSEWNVTTKRRWLTRKTTLNSRRAFCAC
jgi:hypothetical protein